MSGIKFDPKSIFSNSKILRKLVFRPYVLLLEKTLVYWADLENKV